MPSWDHEGQSRHSMSINIEQQVLLRRRLQGQM